MTINKMMARGLHKHKKNRALGLALACSFLAFGAVGVSAQAAGTDFTIGAGTEPDTLDVQGQTSTAVQNYMNYIIEPLVKLGEGGVIAPALAESWEVSEDGKTYTFQLRQDVKFQDGSLFDADAVKFNLDRLMDKSVRVPLRGLYANIEGVQVLDPAKVAIQLRAPEPSLLGALSATNAGMMSPAGMDKNGNTYKLIVHPIGTGPYKFVEYIKAGHIKLQRWDSYWGAAPHFETQTIKIIPEPASREAALLSGQVDMIMQPPSADIGSLKANEKMNVIIGDSTRVIYLAFNNQSKVFEDKRVRQALNYAIDKQAIIKSVLFDAAVPTNSPLSKFMASHCDVGFYEYDPDKSRALLAEAGVSKLQLELIAPSGHYIQDRQAALAISGYLRQVGVSASVRTTDWATYISWVAEPGSKQGPRMNMFGYAGQSPEQATPGMITFFGTGGMPPNGFNTAFYSNEEVDRLWKTASHEVVKEKRDKLYCDAQKIMWEDAPWLFLWNQGIPIVTTADITGVFTLPNEQFNSIYARPKD